MARTYAYYIEYRENGIHDHIQGEQIVAPNRQAAYQIFMDIHNWSVYSAWVSSVTYNNGNYKKFNTFDGKPY